MGNASVTFDLRAQIVGFEDQIKYIEDQISKINPFSNLGKQLKAELKEARRQLDSLNKNGGTGKAYSERDLERYYDKIFSIYNLISSMNSGLGNTQVSDINLEYTTDELTKLRDAWKETKAELDNNIEIGFQQAVKDTTELGKNLKALGIEVDGLTSNQVKLNIEDSLVETSNKIQQLQEKIKQAQSDYENFFNAIAANEDKNVNLQQRLLEAKQKAGSIDLKKSDITNPNVVFDSNKMREYMSSWYERINSYINSHPEQYVLESVGKHLQQAVAFSGLDDENLDFSQLQIKVAEFRTYMQQLFRDEFIRTGGNFEFGNPDKSAKQDTFFNAIFGEELKYNSLKKLFSTDNSAIESAKTQFQNIFNEIMQSPSSKDFNQNLVNSAKAALKTDNLENIFSTISALIDTEVQKLQQKLDDAHQQLEEKAQNLANLQNAKAGLDERQTNLQAASTAISDVETKLREENERLTAELAEKEKQIEQLKQIIANDIKTGVNKKQDENNDNLNKAVQQMKVYRTELGRIEEKQKMLGKIEGLVQRWFSVYAAVRMVSNAIRSVIATVKELDKTITEIAIVTDMSQDDLWNQMSSYTDMARQYAASISGVYKVSQLYYQQGKLNI